jgi:hypothetical protein
VEGKGYKPTEPVKIERRLEEDQLFGSAMGDFDGDRNEDLALLEHGERLRIFFKDARWSAAESYGGTKNDIALEGDRPASLFPRIGTLAGPSGKDQLLVPHNIPELGVRMTYLKLYKKSELTLLAWNGLEMAPVWRQAFAGMLADFALGDALRAGTPQLWAALVGPGGKTVLTCYDLP